ncbi:MAG: transposase, partial [Mycobacterium sp.]|nr:transposase [Mycobacterium sp.]
MRSPLSAAYLHTDTARQSTERFRSHPHARVIESLPGFGPGIGAEFSVATGGHLESFVTPDRLASYAG